jgi:hypothetical protein
MHRASTHRAALRGFARALCGVLPLKRFEEIVPPLPDWLPLPAAAAVDEKLCTDSVTPRGFTRFGCAVPRGFVTASLPHPRKTFLGCRMGPFPARELQRNSSMLTGLIASPPVLPSLRGLHLVYAARGRSPAESPGVSPPKTQCLRPCSDGAAGILPKTYARSPRASLICSCPGPRGAADHPNLQSGACGRSSRCRAPGT